MIYVLDKYIFTFSDQCGRHIKDIFDEYPIFINISALSDHIFNGQ